MNDGSTPFEVPPMDKGWTASSDTQETYPRKRRPKRSPVEAEVVREPLPVITEKDLLAVVISCMQLLSTFLDESFNPLDSDKQPLPHVNTAVMQMLPAAQIYGTAFVKAYPILGFVAGCAILLSPGLDASIEIATGIRKPKILRKDSTDIYTDKYKGNAKQSVVEMPVAIERIPKENSA